MSLKPVTPDNALARLAALCSRGEQAESDLRSKLKTWGVTPHDADGIIRHLKDNNYLNEERYARAFVRDKFRFNGWGRIKIAHALRQKLVPAQVIEQAMTEIDEEEYHAKLIHLLQGKARTLAGRAPQAARAALLRFASSRGFESEWCYRCADEVLHTTGNTDEC